MEGVSVRVFIVFRTHVGFSIFGRGEVFSGDDNRILSATVCWRADAVACDQTLMFDVFVMSS